MGALSINGIPALQDAVRAARARGAPRPEHEPLPPAAARRPRRSSRAFLLEDLEQTILAMGPETVCLVHMEPVQNAGGAFTPPAGYWRGVRELCDRYDILLSADEVITGFGRVGHWFASERYDIRPDLDLLREGPLVVLRGDRRRLATDRVMEPFLERRLDVLARDHLRRPPGHVARSRSRTSRS